MIRPLIPLTGAWITGIISGNQFPSQHISFLFIFSLSLMLMGIFWFFRQKLSLAAALIPLFFYCGFSVIAVRINPILPENEVSRMASKYVVLIEGEVAEVFPVIKNRQRITLNAEYIGGYRRAVVGRLRVTVNNPRELLGVGDRIEFFAQIREIRNFHNPGGFDYVRYMAYQEIWASAYTDGKTVKVLEKAQPSWAKRQLSFLRHELNNKIDARLTGTPKNIMKALILGDRTELSRAERDKFARLGISHLLAISGLHIGIVAWLSFTFMVRIASFFPPMLWKARTRIAAAIFAVFPVLFYGILTGMSVSTQRAVIMVLTFLGATLIKRENDIPSSLALAALILLILDPAALFSISFQLSFISVFSIIYGMAALEQPSSTPVRFLTALLFKIRNLFFVSLFAALGTFPLTAYYFHQFSLISPLSNCIFVPLIGSVVVPLGLLSAAFHFISPAFSLLLLDAGGWVLSAAIKFIDVIAELPFIYMETTVPTMLEIACFYIVLWSVIYYIGLCLRPETKSQDQPPKLRPNTIITIIMIASLIWLGDFGYRLYERYRGKELTAMIIDVGQGSANIIRLPGGKTILIDGGGFYQHDIFDVGERIVSPVLRKKKIKALDIVILTHPDADHINGLFYLVERYPIKEFWSTGDPDQHKSYQTLRQQLSQKGVLITDINTMPRTYQLGDVRLDILYPPVNYLEKRSQDQWRNDNNCSLVVRLNYKSVSILFPGDIMKQAEEEISAMHREELQSDILIAPHHGSRTSGNEIFLQWVQPKAVLISCGWNNRFSHPHPQALQRYSKHNRPVFRTDKNGALTITSNGNTWQVSPFLKDSQPPFIRP